MGVAQSETRLCEEVHLNLAYRWFCRLGLESRVQDRSSLSKNRHGRFAAGNVLRTVIELVVRRCIDAGLVGGQVRSPIANSRSLGALVRGTIIGRFRPRKPCHDRIASHFYRISKAPHALRLQRSS